MDSSEENTIEKIRLHEQDNQEKLREKRTFETTLASIKRNINETIKRVDKMKAELVEVTASSDALEIELTKEHVRRCSLVAQLDASDKELQRLKVESDQGISRVWALRNSLCHEIQKVSDQCDVWALLTKPKHIESTITFKKCPNENTEQTYEHQEILNRALERRQTLLAERDRLLNEPDSGEEFLRCEARQRKFILSRQLLNLHRGPYTCLKMKNCF